MVASPRGRLETPAARGDPSAWRSAPDLEPNEGEQDERYTAMARNRTPRSPAISGRGRFIGRMCDKDPETDLLWRSAFAA
jgi:hypothetical protein